MKGPLVPLVLAFCLAASPAAAEKLVTGLSTDAVEISSSFSGASLTVFGNIEPEAGSADKFVTGPYQVIVVVVGPLETRVARVKHQTAGIWMNREQVVFTGFPSYYQVLASDKLADVTSPDVLAAKAIEPESQARLTAVSGASDAKLLGRELVRLMSKKGHIGVNEQGVTFRSDTLYSAHLALPSDIPNGPFVARTYLFKNGVLLAEHSDGFSVRTAGFERFLSRAATQFPLLYGLAAVLLALFTGWLGGVIFRR